MRRIFGLALGVLLSACSGAAVPLPSAAAPPPARVATAPTPAPIPQVEPSASQEVYTPNRALEVPVPRDALASKKGAEFWSTADGGVNWMNHGEIDKAQPSVRYVAPREGRFGFKIVPLGDDGQREFTPRHGIAPDHVVVIDSAMPEAVALGPEGGNIRDLEVRYDIRNRGFTPIRRVTLHFRPVNSREWKVYGDDADGQSPMTFTQPDGRYALYLACASAHGMAGGPAQAAPDADSAPQLVVTLDTTSPQIELTPFSAPVLRAGTVVKVQWRAADLNPDPAGLTLFHSADGGESWVALAMNVDPSVGSFSWMVPRMEGGRHKLRVTVRDRYGNRGQAETERPFTIDGDLPSVVLFEKPPGILRAGPIGVRYRATDRSSGIEEVALYGRPMEEGAPYRPLARMRNEEGRLEAEIPAEGAWGFLVVAVDGAGQASAQTHAGASPDFISGLDTTPPTVQIKKTVLPEGRVLFLSDRGELEWTARDGVSGPDKITIRIEYSSDGGRNWFAAAARHPNTGSADLRKELPPGKRYQIKVAAQDEAGNEAEDRSAEFDPADAPLPALTLRGIDEGRQYFAGSFATAVWSSPDRMLRETTLEISSDGAKTWQMFTPLHAGAVKITIPRKEGSYHLRATARDTLERAVHSSLISFHVLPTVDQVRVVTDLSMEAAKSARVLIEPRSVVRTSKEIYLEIFDGKEWKRVQDVKNADMSFMAPGVPGEYLLRVSFKTLEDRAFSSNEARFRVVPPREAVAGEGIQLLNFQKGEVVAGGKGRLIALRSGVNYTDIKVEYSEMSGAEGTWREVPGDQLEPVTGGLLWKRLPVVTGRHYRLRVTARDAQDRAFQHESESDFSIDTKAPQAVVRGPLGEAMIPVKLEIASTPSLSPIKQILLHVSVDGGTTWTHQQTFNSGEPILFKPEAPGDYGVMVTARSEAGLAGEAPASGAKPQAVIKARAQAETAPGAATEGPILFTRALPAIVRGETEIEISWASRLTGKVTVSLAAGDKRQVLAKEMPPTGRYLWNVPRMDSRDCRILLEMEGQSAASSKFEIDSSAPAIEDAQIEVSSRR